MIEPDSESIATALREILDSNQIPSGVYSTLYRLVVRGRDGDEPADLLEGIRDVVEAEQINSHVRGQLLALSDTIEAVKPAPNASQKN